MQYPECKSTYICKNGHRRGKQNRICVDCGRQFIDSYRCLRGYSDEVKRERLKKGCEWDSVPLSGSTESITGHSPLGLDRWETSYPMPTPPNYSSGGNTRRSLLPLEYSKLSLGQKTRPGSRVRLTTSNKGF